MHFFVSDVVKTTRHLNKEDRIIGLSLTLHHINHRQLHKSNPFLASVSSNPNYMMWWTTSYPR